MGEKSIPLTDPERITQRLFGGPHFIKMYRQRDGLLRHPKSGKKYRDEEIALAWYESRNAKPETDQ